MRGIHVLFTILWLCRLSFCQTPEEQLNETETGNETELTDYFQTLQENPLRINEATESDLLQFPFISYSSAQRILQIRKKKEFSSLADLLSIPGIDPTAIYRLQPFISFRPANPRWKVTIRSRWQDQIETGRAYRQNKYRGTGLKNYQRIDLSYSPKIRIGVLTEKDPGESNWLDWHSQFIQFDPGMIFSGILIGDYSIEMGQGLVQWGPYGYSKGPNVIFPVQKRAAGIRPYRAIDENSNMRGLAAEGIHRSWHSTIWYSNSRRDASLTETGMVRSLNRSGTHRDSTERKRKGNLRENNFGFCISQVQSSHTVGFVFLTVRYDRPFVVNETTGFLNAFWGNQNTLSSFFYQVNREGIVLFGEVARSRSGGLGNLHGLVLERENTQASLIIHKSQSHFFSPHGNIFGETNDASRNQISWYLGVQSELTGFMQINLSKDQFRSPLPVAGLFPETGNEEFVEIRFLFSSDPISLRYKNDERETTRGSGSPDRLTRRIQKNYRLQWDQYRGKILLRTRGEWVDTRIRAGNKKFRGSLFYQDLQWSPHKKFTLSTRLTFFQTDDFESRIYQYENDLNGIFGNHPFYGRGTHWYILGKCRPSSHLGIQLRYSNFYRDEVNSIGSGDDQIDSPQLRKWGIQFEYFY